VLGVVCWGLPWLRVPVDHLLAGIVIGIALPLLYLSFAGNLQGGDLLPVYIAAAVFTAALLPLRIAMAVGVLGTIAAAIPLLAGWSGVYDRSLLVLVSVVGLLTYTQARMLGNLGRRQREAEGRSRQIEESFMATLGALLFWRLWFSARPIGARLLTGVSVGSVACLWLAAGMEARVLGT